VGLPFGDASSEPVSQSDTVALDWLRLALQGSGDVAYHWDVASDRLHWVGNTREMFGDAAANQD